MAEITKKPSRLRGVSSVKREEIEPLDLRLVTSEPLFQDVGFPIVMQPVSRSIDLAEWASANIESIEASLSKAGAILFRGFGLKRIEEFEQVAQVVCHSLFGGYGDLPPEENTRKIYQSTPYPEQLPILFHNEASHTHRWPLRQLFFCVIPASEGGETPIADCREVYELLAPETALKFKEKSLLYIRNFTDAFDVCWQHFFKTSDPAVVERYCRENSIYFEWKSDGSLRIEQRSPAIVKHPRTGEIVFFNQIQLHHIQFLPADTKASILSLFREGSFPRNVYYGDGSPIEPNVLEEISKAYKKASVRFRWKKGDLLLLDNMLIAHSRSPYKGPRKIVVAMGEMISPKDLAD
jgi:alpha-ketoglutarate-dependent taurine dioxygenase